MILMSIIAGGKTFYVTDIANGVTYNGQWYDPWILDSTDISWGGGAFASLQLGSVSLITGKTNDNGDSLKDIQSYIEWDVTLKWTDYNLGTVTDIFTGVAILRDKNQFTFELKFKTEDFRNENYNLLTPAPNLIINGGEYQGTFVDNDAISVTGEELRVSFALGSTFLAPLDNQSIIDTTVSITNTTKSVSLVEDTDFTLDYASGVITISDTSNVDDGDILSIDYDYSKYLSNAVVYYSGVYYQNTKTDGGHSVSPPTSPWSALSTSTVFSDGRVYPIAFGVLGDSLGTYTGTQGFFARPLLLNQTKYLYWSAYGDPKKVFDDGVEVTFNKLADGTFQLNQRPVGEISMFVDGSTDIVEETVTGVIRKLQTTTYHQDTEPSPNDYDLILGDIWYDTSTDIQYKWNGQDWDIIIEEVKKVIKGSSIEYGSPDTGLNLSQDYLGYYSGSVWTVYIKKDGNFYFGGDATNYVSWDGTYLSVNGVNVSVNGGQTDATRLTIQGAYISSQTSVDDTHRLDYELSEDGQSHWYIWSTTLNEWFDVTSIGISTVSGDISADVTGWFKTSGASGTIAVYGQDLGGGDGVVGFTDSGRAVRGYSNGTGDGVDAFSVDGKGLDCESTSESSVGAEISKPLGGVALYAFANRVASYPTTDRGIGVQAAGYMGAVKLTPTTLPDPGFWSAEDKVEATGCLHYNSADNKVYVFNGTSWVALH